MQAWPFLISASPQLDYCNVVIPDFVKEAGAEREIIRASKDDFRTEKGGAIYLRGYREGLGPIDMVFRATYASGPDMDLGDEVQLLDNFGRKICVCEGIVLRESHMEGHFTDGQLDAALKHSKRYFPDFWKAKEWSPVTSAPFTMPDPKGLALRLDHKESPTLPKQINSRQLNILQKGADAYESTHGNTDDTEDNKKKADQAVTLAFTHSESGTFGSGMSSRSPDDPQERSEAQTVIDDARRSRSTGAKSKAHGGSGKKEYLGGVLISMGISWLIAFADIFFKVFGVIATVFGIIMVLKSLIAPVRNE